MHRGTTTSCVSTALPEGELACLPITSILFTGRGFLSYKMMAPIILGALDGWVRCGFSSTFLCRVFSVCRASQRPAHPPVPITAVVKSSEKTLVICANRTQKQNLPSRLCLVADFVFFLGSLSFIFRECFATPVSISFCRGSKITHFSTKARTSSPVPSSTPTLHLSAPTFSPHPCERSV